MKYPDLNNEKLPIEERVKHLEREAEFVRDFARNNNGQVALIISIVALVLSFIAIIA